MNRKQQSNLPLTPDMIPVAGPAPVIPAASSAPTLPEDATPMIAAEPPAPEAIPEEVIENTLASADFSDYLKMLTQIAKLRDVYDKSRHIQREEYLSRLQFNSILTQAKELKKLYPDFDLAEELKNPVFARLLAPGIGLDLQTVYETIHHQALKRAAMIESGLMLTKAIQSGRTHPIENGLDSRYFTAPLRTDPASLTPEERKDIRNRVMKGERVTF